MQSPIQLLLNYFYRAARQIFWSLPASARASLHGPRHGFVRRMRGLVARPSSFDKGPPGISWPTFYASVLANRDQSTGLIVFEPTVDWGITLFQRPQHMAMALGRKNCIVIYRTTGDGVHGVREVAPNVWVTSAPEVDTLEGAIWSFYSTASLCSPGQMRSRRQRQGQVIYEYIDHIDSAISGGTREISRLNALKKAALLGQADYLVASARNLYQELHSGNTKLPIAYIPNGVDLQHYRDKRHGTARLPQSLLDFKNRHKLIVGYFGAIAPWLWYEVISIMANKRSDIGFVFIGPDYGGCAEKLSGVSNMLYLGAVDYVDLPAYAKCFDVCFIPFVPGDLARSTSPLKLYEYFALEKPVVVTTDMVECIAYPEVHSGSDASTLLAAIDRAFSTRNDLQHRMKLRQLANENSWDVRAEAYLELLGASTKSFDSVTISDV